MCISGVGVGSFPVQSGGSLIFVPAYIPTHLNVEADFLSRDHLLPEWHLLPQVAQAAFCLWGLPEVDLLASSHSTQCQHYFTLETPLPLGALGLNAFSHPWKFQVSYVFPPPALVPLVLSKFLAEHVNSQLRHLLLVAPCWMEAPWLPTALSMLADIPQQCPIIKDLVVDVLVGQVLKGLRYLHLTLWLLSDVCYADKGSLPQSVRWWWGQLKCLHHGSTSSAGGSGWLVCSTGFTKQCHLKLMHHFYLHRPPSRKWFDPWDVEHLLSLLESWAPASSLTTLSWLGRLLLFWHLLLQSIVLI